MGIISSLVKNIKLSRIMSRIDNPSETFSVDKMFEAGMKSIKSNEKSDKAKALDDLFELITNDRDLCRIMKSHNASIDTIKDIYDRLIRFGTGNWVKGAFVPAASIATNPTLDYLLTEATEGKNDNQDEQYERWLKISHNLTQFFGK